MCITHQSLKPGVLLCNGQYQIIRVIGQGGFGITYLAFDKKLETEVCIKEFFPSTLYNRLDDSMSVGVASKSTENIQLADTIKTKFLKEARRLAQLDNPSIVRVRNAFEENNTAYYVMDFINGKSLNEIVKENGPLTLSRALKYIEQVGYALTYIHTRRINHLDVKPANILIDTANDRAVLIDFGLSKQYDDRGNQTSMTPTGVSAGYAPVEQYDANGLAEFSAPTDVYSLGATLYFLLTGLRPPLSLKINEEILLFPDNIPDNIQETIQRAMSMLRQDRFATVSEFINALRAPAPKPQRSAPASTVVKTAVAPKKSKAWVWILITIIIIGACVASWYFFLNKPGEKEEATVAQVDPYALKGFHLHPDNFDILVEVISPDGTIEGYLSEADYKALSDAQRAAVTPIGIYVASGNVEPFIYDFNLQTESQPNLTWADAVSRYGSTMMTLQQAKRLLSDRGDLTKILATLGIAIDGSYQWLRDEFDSNPNEAWCIDLQSLRVGTSDKTSTLPTMRTRAVPVLDGQEAAAAPMESVEVISPDLAFARVTGPVKSMTVYEYETVDNGGQYEQTGNPINVINYSFDPSGRLTYFKNVYPAQFANAEDYVTNNYRMAYNGDSWNPIVTNLRDQSFRVTIVRDSDHRIVSIDDDDYYDFRNRNETITWNNGLVSNISVRCWEWDETYKYFYDNNGQETKSIETAEYGEMNEDSYVEKTYTYLSYDAMGNWTRRRVSSAGRPGLDETIEVRTIEYYH